MRINKIHSSSSQLQLFWGGGGGGESSVNKFVKKITIYNVSKKKKNTVYDC